MELFVHPAVLGRKRVNYAVVLVGRITGLVRPSIVRLPVLCIGRNSKAKNFENPKLR